MQIFHCLRMVFHPNYQVGYDTHIFIKTSGEPTPWVIVFSLDNTKSSEKLPVICIKGSSYKEDPRILFTEVHCIYDNQWLQAPPKGSDVRTKHQKYHRNELSSHLTNHILCHTPNPLSSGIRIMILYGLQCMDLVL